MKKSGINSYIFFLVWPLGSLVANLPYFRSSFFKNLVWLMFIYYGYVIVTSIEGTDIARYAALFEYLSDLPFSNRIEYFSKLNELDLFRAFSFILVSSFSSSVKVYFAFIGFVYGFFYSRILGLLFENFNPSKIATLGIFALFAYLFIFEFYALQFVRFSIAQAIFIYYVLKYYFQGNQKKWVLLSALSILVHFSLILPVLLFFAVSLTALKTVRISFYAFVLTSSISLFDFNVASDFVRSYVPTYIVESKESYLNENYAESLVNSEVKVNWYIEYNMLLKKVFLLALLTILFLKSKYKDIIVKFTPILNFALILGTVGNLVSVIPSGGRFAGISYYILYFVIIVFIVNNNFLRNSPVYEFTTKLIFSFFIIVGLRFAIDTIAIEFFLGNFMTSTITNSNTALIDYIKQFLEL